MKHLSVNFKKEFPGPLMWQLFWLACGAYSEFTFKKAMKRMDKVKKGARVWLNDLGEKSRWTKHQFDPSLKCDVNKTNFVESFNATLGVDRSRPVLTLLEGNVLFLGTSGLYLAYLVLNCFLLYMLLRYEEIMHGQNGSKTGGV